MSGHRHKEIFSISLFLLIFLASIYVAKTRSDFISQLIEPGVAGYFLYFLIVTLGTVVPPLSSLPFIPIAAVILGPLETALLNWAGWVFGSIISFGVARLWREELLEKFPSLNKYQVTQFFPFKNEFWSLVFLRTTLPVDVLSYGLGLFSSVNWKTQTFAAVLGVLPFSFVFAYIGNVSFTAQVLLASITVLVCVLGYLLKHH